MREFLARWVDPPVPPSDPTGPLNMPKTPVLVAVSGGADSLALALAALRAAGEDRVTAVVVDHRLQPGSERHSAATADRLRELGIRDVRVRPVRVGGPGGMEAAARRARYQALSAEAVAVAAAGGSAGSAPVLLGHTRDDQAETVLLGLARGSGPRSVAGMAPWRSPWGRPLLTVRRQDTENYCRLAGLEWWDDPHNADPAFTRVRLRREVLPLLEDVLGGGVAAALARTATLMADDLAALDELADRLRVATAGPDATLAVAALREAPVAVRSRVLRAWAADGGSGPLTAVLIAALDRLTGPVPDGAAVRLPGALDAVRSGAMLRVVPVDGSASGVRS